LSFFTPQFGRVEVIRARSGKNRPVDDAATGLELPDDLELLAGRVLLDGDEREQVLGPVDRRGEHVGRAGSSGHVGHDPLAVPD